MNLADFEDDESAVSATRMWSPALVKQKSAVAMAAAPEGASQARAPPSSCAMALSSASEVGVPRRP